MRKEESAACPGCGEVDDSSEHLIAKCPAYAAQRHSTFADFDPPLTVLRNEPWKVMRFLRRIRRDVAGPPQDATAPDGAPAGAAGAAPSAAPAARPATAAGPAAPHPYPRVGGACPPSLAGASTGAPQGVAASAAAGPTSTTTTTTPTSTGDATATEHECPRPTAPPPTDPTVRQVPRRRGGQQGSHELVRGQRPRKSPDHPP